MKFSELQLEPLLYASIEKLNFSECTPVQAACMPHIFAGKDVAGLAQTGTGKTAAFLIPLMDRILKARLNTQDLSPEQRAYFTERSFSDWRAGDYVLILVPTRELAEQVYDNVQKLSEHSGLKGTAIYGGTGYEKQKEAIKNGVDFVVATPGRLIDLYKEHVIDLKQVRAIVFDEADRMFDMGFKDDMKYILSRVPRERQFLVFSATLNFDVLNTAYQFGSEPIEVDVSRDQAKAENVKDEIFHVGQNEKPAYLLSLLKEHNPKQVIIFSNFKFNVERLARFLSANGFPAMGISSLLSQAQRNRVIEQFKAENEKNILVATDVAARGLDIKGVDMVINYELPGDSESYVHRIGRTGRAGAVGQAFSLVSDLDVDALSRIEDYLKHKVAIGWLDDAKIIKDFKPMQSGDFSERRERTSDRPRGDRRPQDRSRPYKGGRPDRSKNRHEKRGDGSSSHRSENRTDNRRSGSDTRQEAQQGENRRQPGSHKQHGSRRPQHVHTKNGNLRHKTHRRDDRKRPTQVAAKPSTSSVGGKIKKFFKGLFGSN